MKPRVSVIIPTFNRPAFVREAVDSVKAQTFFDTEIIIIEDGRGVAVARNRGVGKAQGEYLAFLDSDDLWKPDKLARQLKALEENPEYKICYTDEVWLRDGKYLNQMKKHRKYSGWIFEHCLPLCIISASSILMKREVFRPFDEKLPVCEDYDLWLRLSLKYPIYFLPEKLIIKRGGHPDQLSKRYPVMDRFRIQALQKLLKADLTDAQRELVLTEIKEKSRIVANGALKRGNLWRWWKYRSYSHSIVAGGLEEIS